MTLPKISRLSICPKHAPHPPPASNKQRRCNQTTGDFTRLSKYNLQQQATADCSVNITAETRLKEGKILVFASTKLSQTDFMKMVVLCDIMHFIRAKTTIE